MKRAAELGLAEA
jgi:TPR repeat protein